MKKLSTVHIHVERVMSSKNKHTILQSTLSVSLLKHKHAENANIGRLLTVYAALVNVCPSVVPE